MTIRRKLTQEMITALVAVIVITDIEVMRRGLVTLPGLPPELILPAFVTVACVGAIIAFLGMIVRSPALLIVIYGGYWLALNLHGVYRFFAKQDGMAWDYVSFIGSLDERTTVYVFAVLVSSLVVLFTGGYPRGLGDGIQSPDHIHPPLGVRRKSEGRWLLHRSAEDDHIERGRHN